MNGAISCASSSRSPAVADVAVIGIPDKRFGEGVKAIVVLRAEQEASEHDLVEFCKGRLAGYKRPRSVDFITELPRNASGKVAPREVLAGARPPGLVGRPAGIDLGFAPSGRMAYSALLGVKRLP